MLNILIDYFSVVPVSYTHLNNFPSNGKIQLFIQVQMMGKGIENHTESGPVSNIIGKHCVVCNTTRPIHISRDKT